MNEYIFILIKAVVLFAFLLLVTRLMGRKQLSQLTFFDYIVGITIGSLTGAVIASKQLNLIHGLIVISVWSILPILLGFLDLKSYPIRKAVDGQPLIIISNGIINTDNMSKARYNMGDLLMQLRQNKVFDISQVQYALLESNGKLSVMKKPEFSTVIKKDMNIQANSEKLIIDLIMDGKILNNNLKFYDIKVEWVYEELKNKYNITNIKNIIYAGLKQDGKIELIISK